MPIQEIQRTDKDLELMDRLFWKLLGSSELIEQARKSGIHIVIEPETEAFLIKRYGEKAEEVVQLTRRDISPCPLCAREAK